MSAKRADMVLAHSLKRVARGNLCSGCGGCTVIAGDKITMEVQPPGYLRPRQHAPLTAEEDRSIAQMCPGLRQDVDADGRQDSPLWGPYVSMHTGHATDPALRYSASSGGGLSAALVYLLESGQVDGVLQVSATPDFPIGNVTTLSETVEDIGFAAGSRYAPSSPLAGLATLLESDRRFAFVGKPCDISALRALSTLDARIDERIPFMLSFFCAGVPSHSGGKAVLAALGTSLKETKAFRFRGMGWPGRATAQLKDGRDLSMTYHESWGKILSKHVQHRCKICADGTGVAADLVCADAWHCDDQGYPLFEEQDGISLMVARTQKGARLLSEAEEAGKLQVSEFSPEVLPAMQPGQTARRRALLARLAGLWCFGRPIPRYTGLHLMTVARQNSLPRNLKNYLGMVRRVLTGKI